MFNRADIIPAEAAPKALGAVTLQRSPATVCSHGPVRLSLRAASLGRLLQQKSCRNGSPAFAGLRRDKESRVYSAGFTLAELLVSIGVLVLLVLLFTQLLNSAATTMTLGNKRMDADSQARQLLDRMAIDLAQMPKRTDVSYYAKTVENPQTAATQSGNPNDQVAFFSAVPGYYSQDGYNSKASLVAYRVNADSNSASYNQLERMGKGLALNGAYARAPIPLLFLDNPPNPTPTPTPTTTIQNIWPAATNSTATDSDCSNTGCYETAGPQVFRFEYYYLLSSSPSVGTANQLSAGPWSNVNSFVIKDVAAIVVAVAVIEFKSKVLVDNSAQVSPPNDNITRLGAQLIDWGSTTCAGCPSVAQWETTPGQLLAQWQAALDANTLGLPRPAISGIRLYERYFYVSQ